MSDRSAPTQRARNECILTNAKEYMSIMIFLLTNMILGIILAFV